MPNDFETRALQKLLGLNQEMVQPMVPDFVNALHMMPGVSGPDDQLMALSGMVPPDIYSSLASLLSPPEIADGGVTPPQIQNTGLVRSEQSLPRAGAVPQRPRTGGPRPGGSMSAAVDQRARERQAAANKAAKERVHKENLARQAKKGKK